MIFEKKKFHVFEQNSGFTLVELMVVVGIIGVLSAVAIPNFKGYQARAKQSEAKVLLSSIYNAETATMSDYDQYATCIEMLGFENAAGKYYGAGFGGGEDPTVTIPGCSTNSVFFVAPGKFQKVGGSVSPSNLGSINDDAKLYNNAIGFVAGAIGSISGDQIDPANNNDVWAINHLKDLRNTRVGYGGTGRTVSLSVDSNTGEFGSDTAAADATTGNGG